MPRERRPTLRSLVIATKGTVVATVAALAVVSVSSPARQMTVEQDDAGAAVHPRVERLIERHDCSATGFGPDVTPRSALVRRDGRIRHVTFERGWAVYTGVTHGTFVALCRGD